MSKDSVLDREILICPGCGGKCTIGKYGVDGLWQVLCVYIDSCGYRSPKRREKDKAIRTHNAIFELGRNANERTNERHLREIALILHELENFLCDSGILPTIHSERLEAIYKDW